MLEDNDEDVPPLDPKKVALFVILLAMVAFAGWRYWRASQAIAAVAEASKDYRKLFPARTVDAPPPVPKPVVAAAAPVSGIGMLKVDDDMRAPKPVPPPMPVAEPAAAPSPAPAAVVKTVAPARVKPAHKAFNQPSLNSGAFSRLNGGSGVSFSGGSMGGGGGKVAAPAEPALPNIPGLPTMPAAPAEQ